MTNEELAIQIKDGHGELVVVLWDQVAAFVQMMARRYYNRLDGCRGVEIEDLTQAGFLALMDAVQGYEPEKGAFLTHLGSWLHAHFGQAAGLKTKRAARDPISSPISLDMETEGGDTLGDLQPDVRNEPEEVEERIYTEQLHAALEKALNMLDAEAAATIRQRFYEGLTLRSIAERSGRTEGHVYRVQNRALSQMYRNARRCGLEEFLDVHTNYFRRAGPQKSSPVEAIVFRREWLREIYRRAGPNGSEITTEGPGR